MRTIHWKGILAATAALTSATTALAREIDIRRDSVVPIRLEDDIDFRHDRRGDRFRARVDGDRTLPYGTRMEGRIRDIRQPRNGRDGYADLELNTLILPDGSRHSISARVVRFDSRYLDRGRDGRYVVRRKETDRGKFVAGGILGGLIIGSLLDKPFEGAFAGAIAGVVLAEANNADERRALSRRDRYGALFLRDFRCHFDGDWDDRYGWDRRDPRDPRYDDDERRDDRYPRDPWDDRYGSNEGPRCEWRGRQLRYGRDLWPYRIDGVWMVPLNETARQLGFEVERRDDDRWFRLDDGHTVVTLEHGSRICRLNDRRETMPGVVTRRNGNIFVPAVVFEWATGTEIRFDGTTYRK